MSAIAESATITSANPQASTTKDATISQDRLWRMSVAQYHLMEQAGILKEDDRLELLEGLLIAKMPKNPPHRISTKLIRQALEKIIVEGWYVDSQEPISLGDSEPEPDAVVVLGKTTDYRDRHPDARSVAIVIEVSDATLESDRTVKQRIYARAGIPIYWILNLRDRQLEVYTEPLSEEGDRGIEPKYQQCQILREAESAIVSLKDETGGGTHPNGNRVLGQISVADLF
ncbi:Uma2 family endonuclease [Tumidithrix elongata RA019]|uniref:Uma2 family endonuclease n=1 Tax=Tumidithrix elongata BACA0141 TaxID=2716417 RepID=A0AAW9PXW9_9CYAN|nr:Uma2 family endonuclease [Tumidithrix elongata RA019]